QQLACTSAGPHRAEERGGSTLRSRCTAEPRCFDRSTGRRSRLVSRGHLASPAGSLFGAVGAWFGAFSNRSVALVAHSSAPPPLLASIPPSSGAHGSGAHAAVLTAAVLTAAA